MLGSLQLILDQDIYKYLPQIVREDVESQRCPSKVAWALLDLWAETERLWGRRGAQDWVSRAYKRVRKSSSTDEMINDMKTYMEARRFEEIKTEWRSFRSGNNLEPGTIYILTSYDRPGIVKVGMVHLRTVDDRVPEIQSKTGLSWEMLYKRDTISVINAEARCHMELPNRIHPRQEFFKVSKKKAISLVDRTVDKQEEEIINWFNWYMDQKLHGNRTVICR